MADVTLTYKGATIGELSESGNKTIKTAGKYCEVDILLEYEKPQGGDNESVSINAWKDVKFYGRVPSEITLKTNGIIGANMFRCPNSSSAYFFYRLEKFNHVPLVPLLFVDIGAFYGAPWVTKEIAESILSTVKYCGEDTFRGCNGIIGDIEAPNLEEFNDYAKSYALTSTNRNGGLFRDCTKITGISCPKLKGAYRDFAYGCTSLKTVYLPKLQILGTNSANRGAFYNCTALESVQLGSVGTSCAVQYNYDFQNCTQSGLTITIYCVGSLVDSNITKIKAGATNATVIVKASETTEYNGTTYQAGDTITTA